MNNYIIFAILNLTPCKFFEKKNFSTNIIIFAKLQLFLLIIENIWTKKNLTSTKTTKKKCFFNGSLLLGQLEFRKSSFLF